MPYKDPAQARASNKRYKAAHPEKRKTPEARKKAAIDQARYRAHNVEKLRAKRAARADQQRIYNAGRTMQHIVRSDEHIALHVNIYAMHIFVSIM